ncbi:Geminin coiled-coil domain-containing protein 1 [Merluccius polli]|uniref:Geminin coiled-coil domain-containing protein 1 n=1 Tax=Merluccius polli TaxID=89951 RepID=A0AA47MZP0_MERPO|nr:Geminin coiled-coil domain-containing protein 1 [Merluccius polli]
MVQGRAPVKSAAVACQDGVFAGGPTPGGPPGYCPPPTARTVDVSMETLASSWAPDDASLASKTQHLPTYGGLCSQPKATNKLSPHLHRNQQLQDTLQQREEELTRLQQENDKLRHFLSSSFVRNLEEKVKDLSSDHRRNLKRSLQQDHRTNQNLGSCRSHPAPHHISKRVCRNLFPEFCSDPGPSREPSLDLWVLRTLGLKDRDTIDPSASPSSCRLLTPSSSSFSAMSSYEASAILPDLPPSHSSSSSDIVMNPDGRNLILSPSLRHPHAHSANANTPATQHEDACQLYYSPDPSGHHPAMATETYHPNTALLSPLTQGPKRPNTALLSPLTQGLSQTLGAGGITPGPPGLCSGSASGPDPPRGFRATHSPQSIQLSPITPSHPTRKTYTTTCPSSHTPTPTPGSVPSFQMLTPPHTPGGHKDAVFRGSLSLSSSFKTHSFPQGQAFIRKDTQGCWSFTWIPKQEL